MRYETFLFTRNQRQDFTAFVRPSLLTNKEISAIGGIFNYVTDVSRLTPEFPSLYYFPLGDYVLLLRHYNGGRKHAGRAIGVIEGIAIRQADAAGIGAALAQIVDQQVDTLSVPVADIETQETETSVERDFVLQPSIKPDEPFVGEFLRRRGEDRLFVPFTLRGREMLTVTLADRRFTSAPYFAFGTNSDVLAQLERLAPVDIASFFKTDRPTFRNRKTNSVSKNINDDLDDTAVDPSMALRPVSRDPSRLRPPSGSDPEAAEDTSVDMDAVSIRTTPLDPNAAEDTSIGMDAVPLRTTPPIDPEAAEDTSIGMDAVSIRSTLSGEPNGDSLEAPEDDDEATILTMRQLRARLRAEEAAQSGGEDQQPPKPDPLQRLLKWISALFSPEK